MSNTTYMDAIRFTHIRMAFLARNLTFADIATRLSTNASAVTNVAKGRTNSRRIRDAIAAALGMSYEELWGPERPINKEKRRQAVGA